MTHQEIYLRIGQNHVWKSEHDENDVRFHGVNYTDNGCQAGLHHLNLPQ